MAKKVKKEIGKEPYRFSRITREDNTTVITLNSDALKVGDILQIALYSPSLDKVELKFKVDKRMTRKSIIKRYNKFFKENNHPAIMK